MLDLSRPIGKLSRQADSRTSQSSARLLLFVYRLRSGAVVSMHGPLLLPNFLPVVL